MKWHPFQAAAITTEVYDGRPPVNIMVFAIKVAVMYRLKAHGIQHNPAGNRYR